MKTALALLFFISTPLFAAAANDSKAPPKNEVHTVKIASDQLLTKKFKPRSRRGWKAPMVDPTVKLYYGDFSEDAYICKVQGRDAILALKMVTTGHFYCDVNLFDLVNLETPITTPEEVLSYIQQGEEIVVSDAEKCIVCEDNPSEYAPSACGHLCMCKACSEKIDPKKCPICRASSQKVIRIFKR